MTSAFAIGCGVAGAAYALKGVLHVGSKLAQNPEAMKQAAALGAGLRGAGSVFKVPSFLSFTKHAGGFDAVMNRREAALILNCRRVLPAPLASVCARARMSASLPLRGVPKRPKSIKTANILKFRLFDFFTFSLPKAQKPCRGRANSPVTFQYTLALA